MEEFLLPFSADLGKVEEDGKSAVDMVIKCPFYVLVEH